MGRSLKICLVLCLLAVFPTAAQAEVQTIDFESGPALGTPFGGQGDISFPLSPGFRPYRTDVGVRAHSGSTVGDLARCGEEADAAGRDAGDCEFFQAQTTALLSRTASSVTLFAGRFTPAEPLRAPEQATLVALDASGRQIATSGPVEIDANGFDTRLSVSSPAGKIAAFRVFATEGFIGENPLNGGDLGIDDVTVSFADGGAADFSVSTSTPIVALVQGQSLEVPVRVTRLNGSTGTIEVSVSGLPKGVSATTLQLRGAETTGTITLSADLTAPDTNFLTTDATLTADPLGDANVGPRPRTATLSIRIAKDFELSSGSIGEGGEVEVKAPPCAPVDVPVKIRRDIAMNREIVLSLRSPEGEVTGLPKGISAEILDSPVVAPGGGLIAERTIRVRADATAALGRRTLVLEARTGNDPTVPPHRLELGVSRAPQTANIVQSGSDSGLGLTPRLGKSGSVVRMQGNGFCPATVVWVANAFAQAPARLVNDHLIEFNVPRNATSGRPTVVPPGPLFAYRLEEKLKIDSFRNVDGFQFGNFGFRDLALSELIEAYGADEVYITVNPCWPFGSCRVRTGLLNPIGLIKWRYIDGKLQDGGGGHCFGISTAVQKLGTKKYPYQKYAHPGERIASSTFEMPPRKGPLESFLDAEQSRQWSDEFLSAWIDRPRSLTDQLNLIKQEFRRGHMPPVFMEVPDPTSAGHAVLAYDIEESTDIANIYVYDSNRPFDPAEDTNGAFHRDRIAAAVIHVDKVAKTWSYEFDDSTEYVGGDKGSLWAIPAGAFPEDASLPGVGVSIRTLFFDPSDGKVITKSSSPTAEFMPGSDSTATPGDGGGTWVSEEDKPLAVEFVGVKQGHYSQSYSAPGFVTSVEDVATAKGVRDTVTGRDETLTFESGRDRALSIELAQQGEAAVTSAATLETHASAAGREVAGFAEDGALTYAHDGAPTNFSFSLTTVRRNGGPATFLSGPVQIGRGDRVRAKALDRDLRRVRLEIRGRDGKTTTRVLRNRGRNQGTVKLRALRASGHRVSLRVKVSGLGRRAIAGVSLRLMDGGRLVARKAVALKRISAGGKVSWRLPRSVKPGRYRLLTDVRAIAGGTRGTTAMGATSVHRAATVRVGR